MATSLISRVARFEKNEQNADAWARGDANTSVDFGTGIQVRSPAKLIADKAAAIDAESARLSNQATTLINSKSQVIDQMIARKSADFDAAADAAIGSISVAAPFAAIASVVRGATIYMKTIAIKIGTL